MRDAHRQVGGDHPGSRQHTRVFQYPLSAFYGIPCYFTKSEDTFSIKAQIARTRGTDHSICPHNAKATSESTQAEGL